MKITTVAANRFSLGSRKPPSVACSVATAEGLQVAALLSAHETG